MATRAIAPRWAAERQFYFWMAAAILATVFAGFAPSFYLRGAVPAYHPYPPMTWLVATHGLIFSAWVLLFMTQVALVSAGRADLHRRLGLAGFAMVVLMAGVGTAAALFAVARDTAPPGVSPLSWLAVPLLDVPVFVSLIGLGLTNRRKPQVHKRFMLVSMIGLLPPSIGRLPWPEAMPFPLIIIGGQLLFLVPLALWDLHSRGRVHWVTAAGAGVLVGSWLFRLAIWQTPWWLAFAGWISRPFA
ncbi:hypothetical protein GON01_05525 [Sphingomonas sp. MAH-20]|uniref:DUF2306 domain-containing protein n=1 Tax=Sphingomonas horti TaxID=2682842 RepID=A0A6I4IZV9_9SPHN|nr:MULTISPECIES: hypothetical protein [Sphingomonas]MBA2918431.1 hypothetical protein [Sphingomonas sp. CGMCC 1.13658]MVO77398.1 hypothetical protein [Sphingomonas horti]